MKHDDQKEHDKQNMGNCLGGEQITYIKTVFCCVNRVFFCAAAIAAAFCMFSRKTSGCIAAICFPLNMHEISA